MLDPWIIEEILRKEEERRQENERGRVEMPMDMPPMRPPDQPSVTPPDEGGQRGVVVIDI
jgi:hypothetical protein